MSQIIINGRKYSGNSVSISGNQVIIDGKIQGPDEKGIDINIVVNGNIESLDVDYASTLTVNGDCGSATSKNGNIECRDILGDAETKNGNIECLGSISGDATTKNGNIKHRK